ncbi:DUF6745 domain-containing protein [Aerosakkonema sp. BLCC-F183]|uniref:DUF6745 domain-containing protein n=1 Tax=Aerosakkonema sp. BLCC-F183 TaxID=3342834 RepID=UPI0035B8FD71
MSQNRITELTSEQETLIPLIGDKWVKIALDTSPTDKQKAEEAIVLAYVYLGLKPPQQILWFDNPLAAVNWMVANRYSLREGFINYNIWLKLEKIIIYFAIERSVEIRLINILHSKLRNIEIITHEILGAVWDAIDEDLFENNRNFIESNLYIGSNGISQVQYLAFYEYLQTIGVDCSKVKGMWEAAKHCALWWDFKHIAIATPKPKAIALDNESRLHAEGKPAIAYKEFNVYAYHGVRLPEKYGECHLKEWRSQWILEEDNAELRRVLIQGIGYDRICQELQAVELDYWREYVLLGIEESIDVEPVYLLKMTCPSTGYVHMLRVPPSVNSAREAIAWVNWGVDPEEFAVET